MWLQRHRSCGDGALPRPSGEAPLHVVWVPVTSVPGHSLSVFFRKGLECRRGLFPVEFPPPASNMMERAVSSFCQDGAALLEEF